MTQYLYGGTPADIVYDTPDLDGVQHIAPGAVVTVFDSIDGNQLAVQMTFNGGFTSTLTADAAGRVQEFIGPDGYTTLFIKTGEGTWYKLTATNLGSVVDTKLDKTAEPAHHTHAVGDVQGLTQIGQQGLAEIDFDPVSNTWPKPTVLPTGRIIFFPPASNPVNVPSWARLTDIWYGPTTGPTALPDPTPDPTPVPDPVTGITLSIPTVTSNLGANIALLATITTTASTTFAYAQIAVRGPQGQNRDTALMQGVVVDGVLQLTGQFTADVSGTWQAFATFNTSGGSDQSSWTDGAKVSFQVTLATAPAPGDGVGRLIASPTGRTLPLKGFSGKSWNSGGFVTNQWDPTASTAFGTYRGRRLDSRLVFAVYDTDSGATNDQLFTVWPQWGNDPENRIIMISIPFQLSNANNVASANGANNANFQLFGQRLTAAGLNTNSCILRVAWETNAGGYPWSMNKPDAATFIKAYQNFERNVHLYAPNVLFDLNFNIGYQSQGGMTWTQVADGCHGSIDSISMDGYDMYTGWRGSASAETAWENQSGVTRNALAAYCRANGYYMSFPEWALVEASSADGTGGGDDPLYITQTHDFFATNADIMGVEHYYNDLGTSDPPLNHYLNLYPNAEAAYRSSARFGNL